MYVKLPQLILAQTAFIWIVARIVNGYPQVRLKQKVKLAEGLDEKCRLT